MEAIKLEVKLPKRIFSIMNLSKKEVEEEVKKIIALKLFQERKLTSGKAAELAGLCISDFMDLTRKYKIPYVHYTEEEIKEEIKEAKELAKKLKKKK